MTATLEMQSTWGKVIVEAVDGCVVSCGLPPLPRNPDKSFQWENDSFSAQSNTDLRVLRCAAEYVYGLFGGETGVLPPLTEPQGTTFRKRVWQEIRAIPLGETLTYGQLAVRMGQPSAARAVGGACGANPLPLFVPCHRVVAAGGRLGGFGSGPAWKRLLLNREGALAGCDVS